MHSKERWTHSLGTLLLAGLAVPVLAVGQTGQPGQEAEAQQETQQEAPAPEQAEVIEGLTMEAELKAVDPDKSIFLVMGEEGKEMLFHYDAQTEVIDHSDGVQGLAGQSGTWLRIGYRAEGTQAFAERLEVIDRPQRDVQPDADEPPATDEAPAATDQPPNG